MARKNIDEFTQPMKWEQQVQNFLFKIFLQFTDKEFFYNNITI